MAYAISEDVWDCVTRQEPEPGFSVDEFGNLTEEFFTPVPVRLTCSNKIMGVDDA